MRPTDLSDLAADVADGAPIDWEAIQSQPATPARRALLRRLRLIERVAQVHASRPSVQEPPVGASLFDPGPTGRDLQGVSPVTWGTLTILEKIGSGTYGDVYRARDARLDRPVALKLLRRCEPNESALESAVIEEGRLVARVRHPNVITVYGAERIDGRVGLWMEFIEGRTLEDELRDRGPFPASEIIAIGRDVASALAAVHGAGLLHRDIKAQNVLRDRAGRIVLADFGAGRELAVDVGEAPGHELAGTPLYLAPELLAGERASSASDVYALGVLLYHLATGSFPIRGRSVGDLRDAHARGARRAIRETRAGLPRLLVAVIERAVHFDRARRYVTASDVESALAAIATRRSTRRNAVVAAGLVTVLVAAAAGSWAVRQGETRDSHGAAIGASSDTDPTRVETTTQPPSPASIVPADAADEPPEGALPLRFEGRDWALIVPFENRTGDAVLDGTLESALEHELANSAFINVVPRQRIDDVLQLMQRPAATPIDVRLGREIALRDGGIRVLLTGRVEKVGPAYVLTTQVVNPVGGAVVRSLVDDAPAQSELLSAVRRQGLRVRAALGEMLSTIRQSEAALERVSTPSLHALQLYSQASAFMGGDGDWHEDSAEQLLRHAVSEDPEFASAYILLAYAMSNQGRPEEEFLPHAERALELAGRTSDVERYFILASYHHMLSGGAAGPVAGEGERRHLRQAVAAYEALLRIKPDHYHGVANLAAAYSRLGEEGEATKWSARFADLRPSSFEANLRAAQRLLPSGEIRQARAYERRARALVTPSLTRQSPLAVAQLETVAARVAWLDGDVRAVRQAADVLARRLDGFPDEGSLPTPRQRLVFIYVGLGRFRDAQSLQGPPERILWEQGWLGESAALESLRGLAVASLRESGTANTEVLTLLNMLDGLREAAARARVAARTADDTVAIEGALAAAEGRLEDSLRLFEAAEHAEVGLPPALRRLIHRGRVRVLARAWEDRGDLQQAARVLADATDGHWTECVSDFDGVPFWIYARDKLSDLYRRMGRVAEADAVDADLSKLLAQADEDHPVRLRLRARKR